MDDTNSMDLVDASTVRPISFYSDTDGWAFKPPKYGRSKKGIVYDGLSPNSEVYNMNHKRRGIALIFNNVHFKKMANRKGAEIDTDSLVSTFKLLGFEIRIYTDAPFKTISSVLVDVSAEDHTDADCLVVVAMSHGESGTLYSADAMYPADILWNYFVGTKCPTLVGKPKLFFVQACRGSDLDDGLQVMHQTDTTSVYSLPTHADILVMYSSYEGFYSFRNAETGSWFIQTLCKELSDNWETHDLMRILTAVIRCVAIEYESFVPHNMKYHKKKQLPSIVSMLTRLVYFGDLPAEFSMSMQRLTTDY